ncbi:MAG: PTS sugar transporter subunit IIA [Deltaproteobacteria bacterium]|nr:PTS sugar transporter subunit IIA [Deltaproteobacteria bacterium]
MKIKQILAKDAIISSLKATSKENVLVEMASLLCRQIPDISPEGITRILIEREKLGSTGIGNGVAIPHGKISQLTQITTAFGRSLPGIPFDSQDSKPAHLFFVLLAPENAASLHLKALARLSRLLKDVHFRNKLLEAKDEQQLYQYIIEEDEKS